MNDLLFGLIVYFIGVIVSIICIYIEYRFFDKKEIKIKTILDEVIFISWIFVLFYLICRIWKGSELVFKNYLSDPIYKFLNTVIWKPKE